jgi:ABC-type lipoprotein release transport system permease subunit
LFRFVRLPYSGHQGIVIENAALRLQLRIKVVATNAFTDIRVSPRDPATYAMAIVLMTAVALLACWNPATRAVRIDPASAREQ